MLYNLTKEELNGVLILMIHNYKKHVDNIDEQIDLNHLVQIKGSEFEISLHYREGYRIVASATNDSEEEREDVDKSIRFTIGYDLTDIDELEVELYSHLAEISKIKYSQQQ